MTWFVGIVVVATMILNAVVLVRMMLTLDRLVAAAKLNADTQVEIQAAARVVAEDLAAQHRRADAVEGVPGEAADVAARSEPVVE